MKALLLCAGRGERLRPLTDRRPKPLIEVGGRALVEHHLFALARAGVGEVIVNLAYKGRMIERTLGSGSRYGVTIRYSREGDVPLNSGGAVAHARSLLGRQPFLVVNSDIYTDYPLDTLVSQPVRAAHLVLVDNPEHNPEGDFALAGDEVSNRGAQTLTFAGIAVYHPDLAPPQSQPRFSIVPALRAAADRGDVSGEHYRGRWLDVGTPERLEQARQIAAS